MTDMQIILSVVVVIVFGYVGYELYKAKKNDGKITMDEVISIATGTTDIVNDMIDELKKIENIGTDSKANDIIKEKLLDYLKGSDKLTDWQRDLIIENIDKFVDIAYNKIIKK